MTSRDLAQNTVDKFNRHTPVGTSVTYAKSEIEGLQITSVEKPAYILGDDVPVVVLQGIGIALIDKVKPFSDHQKESRVAISDQYEITRTARMVLLGVLVLLGLAGLVTAGSTPWSKFGILTSGALAAYVALVTGPSLKIWQRRANR